MSESIKSTGSHAVLFSPVDHAVEEISLLAKSASDPLDSQSESHLLGKEKFYGWGECSDDLSSVQESSQAISVALHEDFPDKPRGNESVSLESTSNKYSQIPVMHDEFDPRRPWRKRPIEISVEKTKPLLSEAGSVLTEDADNDRFIKNPTPDSRNNLQFDTIKDESEVGSVVASTIGIISSSDITELDVAKQALSESQLALNCFQRPIPDFHLSQTLQSDQMFFNDSMFSPRQTYFTTRRKEPFLAGPSSRENSSKMLLNRIPEILDVRNDASDEMNEVDLENNDVNLSKFEQTNQRFSMSEISLSSQSSRSNQNHHEETEDTNVNGRQGAPVKAHVSEFERDNLSTENKGNKSTLFTIEIASTGLGSTQSLDHITSSSSVEKASHLPLLNELEQGESATSFDYDGDDRSVHDNETLPCQGNLGNFQFRSQVEISNDSRRFESEDEEQNKRKPRRRRRTRRRTNVGNRLTRIESRITRQCPGFHRHLKLIIVMCLVLCALALIVYFSQKLIRRGRKHSNQEILPNPTLEPSITPTYRSALQPTKGAPFDENGPTDAFQSQSPSILDISVEPAPYLVPTHAPTDSFTLWPSSNESHPGYGHISQGPSTLDVIAETKTFSQMQAIPGHEVNAYAGSTISFSNEGQFLAVGLQTKSGTVRIYKRDKKKWKQNGGDFLIGECVSHLALSGDGQRLIVSTMDNVQTCESLVKVLQYSSELHDWEPIGTFLKGILTDGGPVAISSNGMRIAMLVSEIDPTGSIFLKARVFEYRMNIRQWVPLGQSLPIYDFDVLGKIVLELSSDGLCLAIGNSSYDKDRGKVEILSYRSIGIEVGWVHIGILEGESQGDKFGFSISLSSNGDMIAVGCIGRKMNSIENAGFCSVYSYSHHGLDWRELGSLMSGNRTDERNGYSLSLSSDGSRLTCCGANSSIAGERSGVARVYDYDGKDWHQVDDDFFLSEGAAFGSSVSMSDDGIFVAVGAPEFTALGIKNEGDIRIYGDIERVELAGRMELQW
jgi:hypothetical protein